MEPLCSSRPACLAPYIGAMLTTLSLVIHLLFAQITCERVQTYIHASTPLLSTSFDSTASVAQVSDMFQGRHPRQDGKSCIGPSKVSQSAVDKRRDARRGGESGRPSAGSRHCKQL
jgi:hypothetical protein